MVFEALIAALDVFDREHADLCTGLVRTALSEMVWKHLEEFVTATPHRYRSELFNRLVAEGEAKGEAKGEANAIIQFLESRGIDVPAAAEATIRGCDDLDQIGEWIRRSATVGTVDELFA